MSETVTIKLSVGFREFGPIISHDVAKIICSVPSLKDVTLTFAAFHSDFYEILAKEGNKSTVQIVLLQNVGCPTSASSQHLAEALCSMPNLNDLQLRGKDFQEEFYSTLNAKASTLQVQYVTLEDVRCPTSASTHYLVDALCSMPNLTKLRLSQKDFLEEFYSTLNSKAPTLQVENLFLYDVEFPTPTSSQNLAESLCTMPNLNDLTFAEMELAEEFCSTLKLKALIIEGSFPQVRKGNFKFNEDSQADFDSFMQSLTDCRWIDTFQDFDEDGNIINLNDEED
eukprot:XP_011671413.1 PREDICTED: uncharacterized protein LOC105441717 [Strongylocentrotus purpuratus]